MTKTNLKQILAVVSLTVFAAGCSPEVGSEGWCDDMKKQEKGNWTADDAGNFAKHCLM